MAHNFQNKSIIKLSKMAIEKLPMGSKSNLSVLPKYIQNTDRSRVQNDQSFFVSSEQKLMQNEHRKISLKTKLLNHRNITKMTLGLPHYNNSTSTSPRYISKNAIKENLIYVKKNETQQHSIPLKVNMITGHHPAHLQVYPI